MLRKLSLFIQLNYIRNLQIKLWQVVFMALWVWGFSQDLWAIWNLRFVEVVFADLLINLSPLNVSLVLIALAIYLVVVFNILTIINDVFVDLVLAASHFVILNLVGYIVMLAEIGIWPFIQVNLLFLVDLIFLLVGRLYLQERANQTMSQMFARYVNRDLLDNLIANPNQMNNTGQLQKVSILFCDLRGFTTLSENTDPKRLVKLLNIYLQQMSGVLVDHKATIDKYIGDAIMCFWNAPISQANHTTLAVDASISMLVRLSQLKKQNPDFMPFSMGIGLHIGPAVVGNIGSERKTDYTVIGDNVNLTSRLEGLTKKYGVELVVSQDVVQEYNPKASKFDLIFRYLDRVKVKGKSQYVDIYQPLVNNQYYRAVKAQYEQGWQYYNKNNHQMAISSWQDPILAQDRPTQLILQKIREYHNPETGWRRGSWRLAN